jgi:hypothetical protein
LDMNEKKASSPGRFWHDVFVTLLWTAGKAGCWGGDQSPIYTALFKMLHAREPASMENVVLQTPYAYACYRGTVDQFECSDALIVNDFDATVKELSNRGFVGLALLIDEADCLGKNVPLLQMFRNIFQTVSSCSLLLAGTDAVFPVLSDVFSPIPRQFHKVDVRPFAHWSDTMQLVRKPLHDNQALELAPKSATIEELHDLCGGDPAEIQLYCHHMYKTIEDGFASTMALSPTVFREVLREYRAISSADVESVLNAIERLPDKLLFESKWLARRNLSVDENVRVEVLSRELANSSELVPEEHAAITSEISTGYTTLFQSGISEIENYIRLAGAPLTSGFWKSFVEVEKGKRWTWDDRSCGENLRAAVATAIGRACDATTQLELVFNGATLKSLDLLRRGEPVEEADESIMEMIVTAIVAKTVKATVAFDVVFHIESPAGRQSFRVRYLEDEKKAISPEFFNDWLKKHASLLTRNEISLKITEINRWTLPTSREVHRLGRILDFPIPDVLGSSEIEVAVEAFKKGKVQETRDAFAQMLADREDEQMRNNLAFCQILLGEFEEGRKNAERATKSDEYEPLYELNLGVAQVLCGNESEGSISLDHALKAFDDPNKKFDPAVALYVLLLDKTKIGVTFETDLPIDAAILINLAVLGKVEKSSLINRLAQLYPEKHSLWLSLIDARIG